MLRRNILLILVFAFAMLAFGCSGSSAPTLPGDVALDNPLRKSLGDFGTVDPDIEIGQPVEGITATFYPDGVSGRSGIEVRIDGELAAVTEDTGSFELPPGVEEGAELEFAVDGEVFYKTTLGVERQAQGPDGPVGDGSLYGVITDETGGVPQALVIVTDGDKYAYDIANSVGVYNVLGAPTGHVLVIAVAELHHGKMKVVDLVPNEPVQLDIQINIAQGLGKIYGRTFVPGVGLIGDVYVNYSQPGGLMRQDISNIYGMYELLDIPAGIGQIYAHRDGFHDFYSPYMLQPGYNLVDLPVIPISFGAIAGTVYNPDGLKVIGALVRLTFINLQGDHEWKFMYTGSQGQYAFGGIPPTTYAVQAFVPGWRPDTQFGTCFEGEVDFKDLTIYQTDQTGAMEGWAVNFDGGGVPFAFAYVEYIGFKDQLSGWIIADENGHFAVDNLPYGPYAVRVETAAFLPDWDFTDIIPSEDGDFFKIVFPFNPQISGAISGTVTNSIGEPQAGAVVRCWAIADPNVAFMSLTGLDGTYSFPYLPPAVFNLYGWKENVGSGSGFDEAVTGETATVDIVLQ